MKILIATDFSAASPTVEAVKALPWPEGSDFCVLHVVDLPPSEAGAELLEIAQRGADSVVKSIARDLEQAGFKSQAAVVVGHAQTGICEFAKKWGADLIVVGSRGSRGLARLLLGSVSQGVVRGAPCSVEVFRPTARGAGKEWRMLFATDGSECAKVAARWIAGRPWPPETTVRILSAVPLFTSAAGVGMNYFDDAQAAELAQVAESEMRAHAVEIIGEAEHILRQGLTLRIEKLEPMSGDPKRVIVEEASQWAAKLIVVGSHGRRGLDRLMTGSVSEFVATHAHCSVQVIRLGLV